MKHTVVIPLYNKENYIYDAIRSLAFQEKKPSQIIIVDDASTDKSLVCLKDSLLFFAPQFLQTEIQIIELKENIGPGNARNLGIEQATGELISFLDADDCYTPSSLREVGSIMEQKNIDVLVVGILLLPSNYYLPNIKSFATELILLSDQLYLIPNVLHTISAPDFIMGLGSNVVIRKKCLNDIRYEKNVSLNEGIDFWYRVLKNIKKEAQVGLLNKACIEVREIEGSLSRISYTNWAALEIPVTIKRYQKSANRYDQQLMGMLSQRWLEHAMERLPSWQQKVLFVLNHASTLLKNYYYFKKRNK
ncbi:glycosyltransferase family 2 protein [Flavobacterium sp. Fl-77]|uniref:Glycosyltransferase family 2 protein n=1 Tax=Flavobacterium flavipigmentatum TaxID=2893884 RepID=A0AAJ2SGT1_9FLAO|nr:MULTISPECIES: glycosyltransferase family 2 protein [unclassified Flavobacterium]MDX6182108.1 glycosyltransferase family 2 protein [Flavobacterium sp. Fl-33]MDX6185979.1 glycosyltransferase family 2 protein [Flavobacterium sp. Fl-77]UFH39154.1 glycosyltransferase [Flavobacterium sp. F-70]